jgi:hypothetical protein
MQMVPLRFMGMVIREHRPYAKGNVKPQAVPQ